MAFIKELYYGNVHPGETKFLPGTQYAKIMKLLCDKEQELLQCLNEEQLKLFNDIEDGWNKIDNIIGEENFCIGFSMGVRMMCDVFCENSSTFKQI